MLPRERLVNAEGLLAREKAGLSAMEKARLIDATNWAEGLSFEQIRKLAPYMDAYTVEKDTVLFCENEKEAFWVLIAEGRVDVVKFDSARSPKRITTLGPGRTIGEMSLIDGEPRSAAAVTASESTLLVMTAEHFEGLNRLHPGVGLRLVLKIAKQMSQYLRQTSGRLIDHLSAG